MKKMNYIVPCCLAIALSVLGSIMWINHSAQQEYAKAQERLAKIKAQPVTETRSVKVDKNGRELHALCQNNWCVTDVVPPERFMKTTSSQSGAQTGGGFPVVNEAALQSILRDHQNRSRDTRN